MNKGSKWILCALNVSAEKRNKRCGVGVNTSEKSGGFGAVFFIKNNNNLAALVFFSFSSPPSLARSEVVGVKEREGAGYVSPPW